MILGLGRSGAARSCLCIDGVSGRHGFWRRRGQPVDGPVDVVGWRQQGLEAFQTRPEQRFRSVPIEEERESLCFLQYPFLFTPDFVHGHSHAKPRRERMSQFIQAVQ